MLTTYIHDIFRDPGRLLVPIGKGTYLDIIEPSRKAHTGYYRTLQRAHTAGYYGTHQRAHTIKQRHDIHTS
ncbi:hypothetical protein RHMOL_Rhmol06G0002400 [Rhododendron molle]|uniref:Uncharacterized protein n=1 Tax=Rhododendron molle TaxID=49168 RepID=A0ACC0N8I4_RHOML|nr:hypothetical protein RHMOL_Rhmol06G0002400 [Rhododendron molle]